MRERMREHLSKAQAGLFDLKQDHGGIADIEFMVQYGVLAWAHKYPVLLDYTDNIRLLEQFPACGLLSTADSSLLCDAYRALRAAAHRLTLQELPAVVDEAEYADYRRAVQRLWQTMMGTE